MSLDERTPLLQFPDGYEQDGSKGGDFYHQFCQLVGITPVDEPPSKKKPKRKAPDESLYHRAVTHLHTQENMYIFTATLVNSLLLSQVVLGAALTALGASNSSPVLVTIFGAMNTIIAGLIAFLKSRGQPMRARMFRDDLERVVDEIENSATMWRGISDRVHGYDEIDTTDQVTVRSEVARLTRLYDKAVKTNTMNDPDMYAAGAPGDPYSAALRSRSTQNAAPPVSGAPVPAVSAAPGAPAPVNALAGAPTDEESPATKLPEKKPNRVEAAQDDGKAKPDDKKTDDTSGKEPIPEPASAPMAGPSKAAAPEPAKQPAQPKAGPAADQAATSGADPDKEPATAAVPEKHSEDTSRG